MEKSREIITNAEIAFSNEQYDEALKWYEKALEQTPDDVYVLNKAGAISAGLEKYENALKYFGRAKDLDPYNGDTAFNFANVCYLNQDNVSAFEWFVKAEKLGCSDDVLPKLYYHMALLCNLRQDFKSALIYMRKCEEADKTGSVALTSDFISEKIKVYILEQDFEGAADYAARLAAVRPADLTNYMVYFSMLMAQKEYDRAMMVLDDAEKYAEIDPGSKHVIDMQRASLYVAAGDNDASLKDDYYRKSVEILENIVEDEDLSSEIKAEVMLSLAEVNMKMEEFDKCLDRLNVLTDIAEISDAVQAELPDAANAEELTPEKLDAMMRADMEAIAEKIGTGEIDENMGMYAATDYDEAGNPVHIYDENAFAVLNNADGSDHSDEDDTADRTVSGSAFELSVELKDRVDFIYLSCYLAKDDFGSAAVYADILRNSKNKYYQYYGIYTYAMTARRLHGETDEVKKQYAEAIAFFRNQTFTDPGDYFAVIFRARLYAEDGKYEKAREIAQLLAESDRRSIMDYIEECKNEQH